MRVLAAELQSVGRTGEQTAMVETDEYGALPWEDERKNVLARYLSTMRSALWHPSDFFAGLPAGRALPAFVFAVVNQAIYFVLSADFHATHAAAQSALVFPASLIYAFMLTALIHVCCGPASGATIALRSFRASCYATASLPVMALLGLLPTKGLLAIPWFLGHTFCVVFQISGNIYRRAWAWSLAAAIIVAPLIFASFLVVTSRVSWLVLWWFS